MKATCEKFQHVRGDRIIWASGLGELDEHIRHAEEIYRLQPWSDNALLDGGENLLLGMAFQAATAPTSMYFALLTAAPAETVTPGTWAEVTGGGYARVAVARNTTDWPTLALDSGDYQVTSAQKTFGPLTGSNYSAAVTHLGVTTSSTGAGSGVNGLAVAAVGLSTPRTLVIGDSLNVTYALKLS